MLELAALTAERLVADAEANANSLVTGAQAQADAILEASRKEAVRMSDDLARSRKEQAEELKQERATTLAGLRDTKTALETQIIDLRETESVHRQQLRLLLTEHLETLDASMPSPDGETAGWRRPRRRVRWGLRRGTSVTHAVVTLGRRSRAAPWARTH